MQFKLENIPGASSTVELTFKVDYKKALELIAFANGELKIMPEEFEERAYRIHIVKTEANFKYDERENSFDKIRCIRRFRETTGYGLKESKEFTEGNSRILSYKMVMELANNGIFVTPA